MIHRDPQARLPHRDPHDEEIGIIMELITDDPFLSLGYDVRIVKVKWLRSGLARAYPIDLVVIS